MKKLTEVIAHFNAHIAECKFCEAGDDWTKFSTQLCWRGNKAFGAILFWASKLGK